MLGANARAYVAREHTLEAAAAGYMRFLSDRYGWGATPKLRAEPLWNPRMDFKPPTQKQNLPDLPPRAPASIAPDNALPIAALAKALTEIGATEDDRALLEGAAQALAELIGIRE